MSSAPFVNPELEKAVMIWTRRNEEFKKKKKIKNYLVPIPHHFAKGLAQEKTGEKKKS